MTTTTTASRPVDTTKLTTLLDSHINSRDYSLHNNRVILARYVDAGGIMYALRTKFRGVKFEIDGDNVITMSVK